MRTIKKIITKVSCKYGAPQGRNNTGNREDVTSKIYDCAVPMGNGGYDTGGTYWGIGMNGEQLRVSYTKDLTYIHFYRTKGYNHENTI